MFDILYFIKVSIFGFLVSLLVLYNMCIHFVAIDPICVIFCVIPLLLLLLLLLLLFTVIGVLPGGSDILHVNKT